MPVSTPDKCRKLALRQEDGGCMARDNKVVTYEQADGRSAKTGATQDQVEALRKTGKLQAVRRVRMWRNH